jgi:hypothetical protein
MTKLELLAEFRQVGEKILQLQSHLQDLEMQINIGTNHEQEIV